MPATNGCAKPGVILSQAVLITIGVHRDSRRQVLAVELANHESRSSWWDFLRALNRAWILRQPTLMAALHELRGKNLVCWCAPQRCFR